MSPERLAEIRAAIDLALEVLPPKGRARYLTAQWFWTAGIDLLAEVDRLRSVEAAAVEWFEAGADVVSPDARAHRANYNLRRAVRAALSGEHPEQQT